MSTAPPADVYKLQACNRRNEKKKRLDICCNCNPVIQWIRIRLIYGLILLSV